MCLSKIGFFAALFAPLSVLALSSDIDEREGIKLGGVPVFNYTTDDGLEVGAFGMRFDYGNERKRPFENLWSLGASYATEGPRLLALYYEETTITDWNLRLKAALTVSTNPDANYFGLGDRASFDRELGKKGFYRFTQDYHSMGFVVRKKLPTGIEPFAGAHFAAIEFRNNRAETKFYEDFKKDSISFFSPRVKFGAIWDVRDFEFIPSSGQVAAVEITTSPKVSSDATSWAKWESEFRNYQPIIENRWLWFASQIKYTASTDSTPITDRARIGGEDSLRGIQKGRFLVNHAVAFRNELRSVWFRERVFGLPLKAGTGVFADLGRAGDTASRLFEGETHVGYGVSFFGSYFTDDFLGHMDFGASKEGRSVYIAVGHAF